MTATVKPRRKQIDRRPSMPETEALRQLREIGGRMAAHLRTTGDLVAIGSADKTALAMVREWESATWRLKSAQAMQREGRSDVR